MTFIRTTWVDRAVPRLTAAQLNRIEQGITDAHAGLAFPSVRVATTASQLIVGNALTYVNFASEVYDSDNMHDNVTNNSRITCVKSGLHRIYGQTQWSASAPGRRLTRVMVNNATEICRMDIGGPTNGPGGDCAQPVACEYRLVAGDYIQLQVLQNAVASPATIPLDAAWLSMSWTGA